MTAPTPPPMPPTPGWQPQAEPSPYPAYQPGPTPRRPRGRHWGFWAAIAAVAVVVIVGGVLVGTRTAHHSTLSQDDQQFCSDQATKLEPARDALNDIVTGDRHWSSDGEVFAVSQATITPAYEYLWAQHAQSGALAADVKAAGDAVFDVELQLRPSDPDAGFADDAAKSRTAMQALQGLQSFCDANG